MSVYPFLQKPSWLDIKNDYRIGVNNLDTSKKRIMMKAKYVLSYNNKMIYRIKT